MAEILMETGNDPKLEKDNRVFFFISVLYKLR